MSGSRVFAIFVIGAACAHALAAHAAPLPVDNPANSKARTGTGPVGHLAQLGGIADRGIFSDLASRVRLKRPPGPVDRAVRLLSRPVLLLYQGRRAVFACAWDGRGTPPRACAANASIRSAARAPGGDRDRDGLPDALDVLIGAKKTVLNGARYGAGYLRLAYPGGDVPRDRGVCTDVVIRALRNAGLDLQVEVQRDIRRARRAYPMVTRANPHIDHRRVRTLLPYFRRHWEHHSARTDDPDDPLRPGDVVLMDTMPSRPGPDHIGILSDRRGPSGHLLVINNWTNGFRTSEMDLLGFVPLTQRFRVPPGGLR